MSKATAVQHLDWDSNFLGFQVGRLNADLLTVRQLQEQLGLGRAAGYRLLYWSVSPSDFESIASAQATSAFLADHKIRLVQSVKVGTMHLPDRIYPVMTATEHLQALAVQASEYSRFRVDPSFDLGVADQLYAEWLRQALKQNLMHDVLVYQAHANVPPTGVLILRNMEARIEITMIAVDKACRGQGIGSLLIEAARRYTRAQNLASLQVVTQGINPARRLYEREGFRLEHEEYLYHLWL